MDTLLSITWCVMCCGDAFGCNPGSCFVYNVPSFSDEAVSYAKAQTKELFVDLQGACCGLEGVLFSSAAEGSLG